MIPNMQDDLQQDFVLERLPSNTFRLLHDTKTVKGNIDNIQSVAQAVFFILHTERYAWLIHSWDYGVEVWDLIGTDTAYAIPEIERRIREALLQDDRITSVEDFVFTIEKKKVHTTFTVKTIFGALQADKEVEL